MTRRGFIRTLWQDQTRFVTRFTDQPPPVRIPGRLVGHVAYERDLLDVFTSQRAASQLLGAGVELFSDAVLTHDNVSSDLAAARAL